MKIYKSSAINVELIEFYNKNEGKDDRLPCYPKPFMLVCDINTDLYLKNRHAFSISRNMFLPYNDYGIDRIIANPNEVIVVLDSAFDYFCFIGSGKLGIAL